MSRPFLQKAVALALVALFCLAVCCACAKNPVDDTDNLPELVIGIDYYEPFSYKNDYGEFEGIDIDIATEVCKQIGFKPKFVPVVWSEKKSWLQDGRVDCIWCCFTMTGREDDYSWSVPYMNSRQVVAVLEESNVYTIDDLVNKRVAVQSTTKADEIFSGRAGKSVTIPNIKELNCFSSANLMFAAINDGYVDAIAGHELVLRTHMKSSSTKLRILEEPLLEVQLGIAFLKGTNQDMIQKINDTLRLLVSSGFMSELISDYGLDPDVYVVRYE